MDDQLGQLLDRQEIIDQMHAYARLVDLNRPEEVAEVFVDDGRMNHGPGDAGWITGRDDIVDSLRSSLASYSATNHTISNIEIVFVRTDEAQATSYVQAWHSFGDDRPAGLFYGRYHDAWVRTPDGWRLRERRLKVAGGAFAKPKEPIGRAGTPT